MKRADELAVGSRSNDALESSGRTLTNLEAQQRVICQPDPERVSVAPRIEADGNVTMVYGCAELLRNWADVCDALLCEEFDGSTLRFKVPPHCLDEFR